jgi:hypothetical protein
MQFFLQYVRLMFDVVSREAQVQHLNMGYHTIPEAYVSYQYFLDKGLSITRKLLKQVFTPGLQMGSLSEDIFVGIQMTRIEKQI